MNEQRVLVAALGGAKISVRAVREWSGSGGVRCSQGQKGADGGYNFMQEHMTQRPLYVQSVNVGTVQRKYTKPKKRKYASYTVHVYFRSSGCCQNGWTG